MTPPGGEELRESIARAIYSEGAYCGDCSYESWESCSECRRVCMGYAVAVLALPAVRERGEHA